MLDFTARTVGTEYELGKYDCFILIVNYLRDRGMEIPTSAEYRGLTFENYKYEYEKNPDIINYAFEYLLKFGCEIKISDIIAGDILLLENEDGSKFLGIDGGNGTTVTAVIGKGIQVLKNCRRIGAIRIG